MSKRVLIFLGVLLALAAAPIAATLQLIVAVGAYLVVLFPVIARSDSEHAKRITELESSRQELLRRCARADDALLRLDLAAGEVLDASALGDVALDEKLLALGEVRSHLSEAR